MGFVKSLFGGGTKPYKSKNTAEYEGTAKDRVYQRLGNSSAPLTGEYGVNKATAGYDFSPQNEAVAGFQKPRLFNQEYKPTQFNFKGLPEQYGTTAYNRGAMDLRRENQGQLEQAKQNIGVRRPGLLLKADENYGRRLDENLGKMRTDIGLKEMESGMDMNRAQQEAQAGENYRGYQSASDLERANAQQEDQRLGHLYDAGQGMINTKSGLVQGERGYEDAALNYIMSLFGQGAGLQNNAAQADAQKQASTLGFLSSLLPGTSSIIKAAKGN